MKKLGFEICLLFKLVHDTLIKRVVKTFIIRHFMTADIDFYDTVRKFLSNFPYEKKNKTKIFICSLVQEPRFCRYTDTHLKRITPHRELITKC